MTEIRYPQMDLNVLLAQMEKQEELRQKNIKLAEKQEVSRIKEIKRKVQKYEREQRDMERDDLACDGLFSVHDHMSNVEASNQLLQRLQYYHGDNR